MSHGSVQESRTLFIAPLASKGSSKIPIKKVLIANRGEIACRVIKTCRLLGVISVAIYVDEDTSSRHVTDADVALCIGSIAADSNPYLNAKLIVQTAVAAGADAIHPGYGYLSESADFADEVRNAGLIFVGPNRLALSTLGDKRAAKDFLGKKAPEVPLIPGFGGSSQEIADLTAAAEEIGYPLMVKASAGGGGKGLKVAHNVSQLKEALERAQSEALRSFGSSDCILEKYIDAGKHVEMQIVGDRHGNVVCFWERDCSVQRRNQKIIEETPCSWLDDALRLKMKDAAVRIGSLIDYEGAGTVEFIVDVRKREFYFLEVNARLQVEHPITEEVTGVDLVALQLFVAGGGDLTSLAPLQDIRQTGHSIECRLCAEDPNKGFIPERGVVAKWQPAPNTGSHTRFETALMTGSEVSIYFDSMLAKIIVWAADRQQAINAMVHVLRETSCVGVRTNQLFLQSCLLHEAFREPSYTTSFIGDHLEQLLENPYITRQPRLREITPLISAMYSNYLAAHPTQQGTQSRSFQHAPLGFRNQRSDPMSYRGRIVTTPELELPRIILEPYKTMDNTRTVFSTMLPVQDDATKAGVGSYNALSNAIRSGEVKQWPSFSVSSFSILPCPELPPVADSGVASSLGYNVSATIDGVNVKACIIDSSSDETTGSETLLCHIPLLGTWSAHRCQTLLAFFRDQNQTTRITGAVDKHLLTTSMPCKILSMLKKGGEKVAVGDVVFVIESMKMETNIVAAMDGTFEPIAKVGDFANEGSVLGKIL